MPTTRAARTASAAAALLVLTACTSAVAPAPAEARPDGRPVVLATFTVLADMAAVVAGPDARVESLTDPGTEIHGYEPSPDDLRRAAGADLVVANGLGLEAWLEGLLEPLDVPTAVLTDDVDPLPTSPGTQHVNPHAWMSPRAGRQYVTAIERALVRLDPAHADAYRARADGYRDALDRLHAELVADLAGVPREHRVLVSCEGAFGYLARDADLDEIYLWPVNAERQGTPRQVGRVILEVRRREVPVVFCESTLADTTQRQVARESGAAFGGSLYVDSLSGPDGPVPTYLDLLRYDVDLVVAGLTGETS